MPEEPNNTQQFNFNSYNPMQQWSGDDVKDIAQALRILTSNGPDSLKALGLGRRAPMESQSNFASEGSKWKIEERHSQPRRRSSGSLLEDFESGIRDQLLDSLAGGNFKKSMQNALDTFAKEFGMDIRDLPNEVGRKLTKNAYDAFKNSETGKAMSKKVGEFGSQALDSIFKNVKGGDAIKGGVKNVVKSFLSNGASGAGSSGGLFSGMVSASGTTGAAVAEGAGTAAVAGGGAAASGGAAGAATAGTAAAGTAGGGAAAGGAVAAGAASGPPGWVVLAVIAAVVVAAETLAPALEGLASLVKSVGKSFTKDEDLRKKRAENARKRLEADMEWIAKKPFEILEEAAQKWSDTWDSNLRTVGQTQGYDKEAVYALYEGYAERLRNEGLASVINATDIADKLASVLESGLSGKVAEEFAYEATKLGAAIPTQDFFQYADTYASIAANAIAQGRSQRDALNAANAELEQFASNLLYSSRELAGGFSTGLKNSSDLFKQATQIAQSAKTYNASEISGTLTSVSAIIGAVAPDLADSLVTNIVNAAIGGNDSSIVALRSLAGINASNTEFLRAIAQDPKSVFASLFNQLANYQNMAPDNFMEAAEGLAEVFGIDKAAFARVDFNYLADAIASMDTNNGSLQENLDLLVSGQTTTSAEQLKAQEINRMILNEGLAYVIDSEAGRMIQQHMWDEQLANEIESNTYAVDIQGSALEFLEGIRRSMTTLLNFLNPVGFIAKGVANMVESVSTAIGNEQDLAEILKLGAVGSNTTAFNNLTTRGKDLGLTTSLVEMMGGSKGVAALNWYAKGLQANANMFGLFSSGSFNWINDQARGNLSVASPLSMAIGLVRRAAEGFDSGSNAVTSRYGWNTVGKSVAQALQSTPINTKSYVGSIVSNVASATQFSQESSNKRFQEFINTAAEAAKTMNYEQWVATARTKGISDFSQALSDYGRTEEELRSFFEENEAQAGARIEAARKEDEQLFRDQNRDFWDYESGSSGVFQTALWIPFFGDGQKYDTRMDAVDMAMAELQLQIGSAEKHTVIGGLEEISRKLGEDADYTVIGVLEQMRRDISTTFVTTSSIFQKCLRGWISYLEDVERYSTNVSKSSAWTDLKNAEKDQQTEATLALANALGVFSAEELKKLDPQLQTNVLLGEILVVVQAMMQQNNTAGGGLTLPDTLSALGLGVTLNR